jgi:1-acyl-sn-glycerol-3-phosphate acyltransferase
LGAAGLLRTAGIGATTALAALVAIVAGAVTRSERIPARIMAWWGKRLVRLGGWKVRAEGLSHLPREGAVLVVNHQSLLDIPLLLSVLPGEIRFLAKRDLARIPLFGRAMLMAGNLLIDRDDPRDMLHLVREAAGRIRGGQSVVVFPEGTRSADGTIGEFKSGAFSIARKSDARVVPIYIDGIRRALPKGSLRIHPAEIGLMVLPPIDPKEGLSRQGMADEARRRIAEAHRAAAARRKAES